MQIVDRALYAGAVLSDHVARTVLSTAMTGAMTPQGLAVDGRAEVRRLDYYAALAASKNPDTIFAPPPSPIPVHTRPGRGLEQAGGRVEVLRFHSPFEPLHPELRRNFRHTANNATARAQHWRHEDGPRPTLIVIHGMSASQASVNATLFSLTSFFADGWDIVLFTLPFHGGRQSDRSPFNGAELFAGGFAHFAEAMAQAICDLRVVLDHLERKGVTQIGATGISLGGYTTALLAAVDDRLDFAIPNCTVSDIPRLIGDWVPAQLGLQLLQRIKGIPRDLITRSASFHSPLNYPRKLPVERLLIIAGQADRVSPPQQSLALWEHWDRPELHWFPGGHLVHLQRGDYLRRMRRLMSAAREVPAPQEPHRQRLRNM